MHTPSCCTWDARHYHRSWVSWRETKEPQQLDSRGLRGLASRCRCGFTVLQPVPGSTPRVNRAIHQCSTCMDAISYSFWDWDFSSATQWSSLTHRCHKNSMFKVWFLEIHALAHTFIKAEASKQTKTWTFPPFLGMVTAVQLSCTLLQAKRGNLPQSPSSWHIYTNWFFPKSEYKHSDTRRAGPTEKDMVFKLELWQEHVKHWSQC